MAKIDPVIFDMTRKIREIIRALNDTDDQVSTVVEVVDELSNLPIPLPSNYVVGEYEGITKVGTLEEPVTSSWWEHPQTISVNRIMPSGRAAVMAGPITIASGVVITINGTLVIL